MQTVNLKYVHFYKEIVQNETRMKHSVQERAEKQTG